MVNVLLVQTVNSARNLDANDTPLGLAYLAGYLRVHMKDVSINIISSDEKLDFMKYKPDIVGMTSVSQNFNIAKELAAMIKKEKNIPIAIGGHHISALPHLLTKDMDVAAIGEGEQTFLEIVELVKSKKFSAANLHNVKGIAFRENGKMVFTGPRERLSLDEIPFPARDLLKNAGAHILSSRGCPYKCVFCSSSHFWSNIRFHSPEYVIKEIKEVIKQYNPKTIAFWDDLFIADKARVKKIVGLIKKEGINKKVSFSVLARTNLIDDEICKLLKEMNTSAVMCGFESGSQKVLDYLKRGTTTVEKNQNAINLLKKYGFNFAGTFIIGSPEETMEDMEKTLKFIRKNDFQNGDTYVLTPLPGTPLWQYAVEKGLVREDEKMDWSILNIDFEKNMDRAVIVSEKLSRDEIKKMYFRFKKAWEEKDAKKRSFTGMLKRFSIKDLAKMGLYNPRKAFSYATKRIKFLVTGK